MSTIEAASNTPQLPLSDDLSKEVVTALRNLSGELNDLSVNLYTQNQIIENGSIADGEASKGLRAEID